MTAYTVEEVVRRFAALFLSFDYEKEYALLGISRLHPHRRKRARHEFMALYISLWRLALEKSMPQDAEEISQTYLETMGEELKEDDKELRLLRQQVEVYDTLLAPTKDGDFKEISQFLLKNVFKDDKERENLALKISLAVRETYNLIFERLV